MSDLLLPPTPKILRNICHGLYIKNNNNNNKLKISVYLSNNNILFFY